MPPLMPCPWCGTAASIDFGAMPPVWAACPNTGCLVTGPAALTVEDAAEKWNGLAVRLDGVPAGVRTLAPCAIQKSGEGYRVRLGPMAELHVGAEDLAALYVQLGAALAASDQCGAHDGSGAVHFPAEIEQDARCAV